MNKLFSQKNLLSLCLGLGVSLVSPQLFSSANAATQAEIDNVKEILVENPEILKEVLKEHKTLLNESVLEILRDNKVLLIDIIQQGADSKRRQQLQAQWAEDLKTPKKTTLEGRPSRGPENAPITLVAFSDFACTYCMQAAATIENLLARYPNQIRFVFKQFASEAPVAQEASRWFLAALNQDQEKGWNFYANLFANQSEFFANPDATLRAVAEQAGLNLKALENDLKKNHKKYSTIVEEDIADARKLGFTGTPYFLMNDLVIRGALPLESFIDAYSFALQNIKK